VTFVERDARLAAALRANLARLKVDGEVVGDDASRWLRGPGRPFDVVLLDPPFALDAWETTARQLEDGGWIAAHGWIYVEAPRGGALSLPLNWLLHRQGHAGEVAYALYRRTPADPLS
jgi:16S rRNA (guanine966-N2)-methyltransferase